MKKRIAVLLTLVMIFSVFCAVPASADGEDTFHFTHPHCGVQL